MIHANSSIMAMPATQPSHETENGRDSTPTPMTCSLEGVGASRPR